MGSGTGFCCCRLDEEVNGVEFSREDELDPPASVDVDAVGCEGSADDAVA